jgi:hypothetical protein
MAKTHEIFRSPAFFQFLSVTKGTPVFHRAQQSQETDAPFRAAKPWVLRIPLTIRPYFYPTIGFKMKKGLTGSTDPADWVTYIRGFSFGIAFAFNSAVAVGYWRETGYDEHTALAHALNINDEHANATATDFETAAEGLNNDSTELGKQAQPFADGRTYTVRDAGPDA